MTSIIHNTVSMLKEVSVIANIIVRSYFEH